MENNDIPQQWKRGTNNLTKKSSRLEYQTLSALVDSQVSINTEPSRPLIVTYNDIHQTSRTIGPRKLIKDQVNKERGFLIDKTEKPVQMIINNSDVNTLVTPGFATGKLFLKRDNYFDYSEVVPKNSITVIEGYKPDDKQYVSQLQSLIQIKPKKTLDKSPLYDADRNITNFTPIQPIEQDVNIFRPIQ